MLLGNNLENAKEELSRVREEERAEEFREALLVCSSKMSLPLFLLFWLADLVYAPDLKWEFLGLRILIIPSSLTIHSFCNRSQLSLKVLQNIGLFFAFINGIIITVMILMTSGPNSQYYAGLNLVSLGILSFFPWTNKYLVATLLTIFLPYYCGILFFGLNEVGLRSLYLNTFFIVGTVVASMVIRWFREKLKLNEILAKQQLKENNKELETALHQLKTAQIKIIQNSQMVEIGRLAASVAHEISSPLRGVAWAQGSLENVIKQGKFGEKEIAYITEDIAKIKEGIKYINSVISNINNAAGSSETPVQDESIYELVQVAIGLTGFNFKGKANLTVEIDPSIKARLQKVKAIRCCINLITNAVQAMDEAKTPDATIVFRASETGDTCRLSISDNGPGIPDKILSKIFHPFNTSKQAGLGTGIGLSMVKSMMEDMDGKIEFKTSSKGTEFILIFPRNIPQS